MLILPLIWKSLATLATALMVTVGNGVSVFVEHAYKPLHATIGHGSTWFRQTIGDVYALSMYVPLSWFSCPCSSLRTYSWSSNAPGVSEPSFYDMYYIPPPVIDPFSVDITLLDTQFAPLDSDDIQDEEGPVARFEWALLDEDELPVKVMRFKPAEHVSVPLLVHRFRVAALRLTGLDLAPTPDLGKITLFLVFLNLLCLAGIADWWYYWHNERLDEYWLLPWLDRYFDVVFPQQQEYVIDL